MVARRERNARIQQVLVHLSIYDYCQGMTTISRGVGMAYSSHFRKILDVMVTLGYLRYADIAAGTKTYRKWAIDWDSVRNDDHELFEELFVLRRRAMRDGIR